MSRVTILVGLPGSGKSTIAKQLQEIYGATIVCPDTIREELTGDINDQSRNTEVFRTAENQIYDAVSHNKDVIYDATNIHRYARMNLIQKIRKSLSRHVNPIIDCIIVAPDIDEVRDRNLKRDRTVPDDVIDRMLSHWETPMNFEGFDNIYINHAGDEPDEFRNAHDSVRKCYDGKAVGVMSGLVTYNVTKGMAKRRVELTRTIMKRSGAQDYRWDDAIRDEAIVAASFIGCGTFEPLSAKSYDNLRHISAYISLTYTYDRLYVDPVLVSYLVESYGYAPEKWLLFEDPITYNCAESLYNAMLAIGFCDKICESD